MAFVAAAAKDTISYNEIAEAETATYEKYILYNCSAVEWVRYIVNFIRLRLLSVYPSILCRYKLLFNSCATFLIWNGKLEAVVPPLQLQLRVDCWACLFTLQFATNNCSGKYKEKKKVPTSVHLYPCCDLFCAITVADKSFDQTTKFPLRIIAVGGLMSVPFLEHFVCLASSPSATGESYICIVIER